MRDYNYRHFPLEMSMEDFERFPLASRVGTKAPDGELVDARDESRVKLSDFFSRSVTVIEFGSLT